LYGFHVCSFFFFYRRRLSSPFAVITTGFFFPFTQFFLNSFLFHTKTQRIFLFLVPLPLFFLTFAPTKEDRPTEELDRKKKKKLAASANKQMKKTKQNARHNRNRQKKKEKQIEKFVCCLVVRTPPVIKASICIVP